MIMSEKSNIISIFEDKKKSERRGFRKRGGGVKIRIFPTFVKFSCLLRETNRTEIEFLPHDAWNFQNSQSSSKRVELKNEK